MWIEKIHQAFKTNDENLIRKTLAEWVDSHHLRLEQYQKDLIISGIMDWRSGHRLATQKDAKGEWGNLFPEYSTVQDDEDKFYEVVDQILKWRAEQFISLQENDGKPRYFDLGLTIDFEKINAGDRSGDERDIKEIISDIKKKAGPAALQRLYRVRKEFCEVLDGNPRMKIISRFMFSKPSRFQHLWKLLFLLGVDDFLVFMNEEHATLKLMTRKRLELAERGLRFYKDQIAGKSISEIAKEYGVQPVTVSKWLGIYRKLMKDTISTETLEQEIDFDNQMLEFLCGAELCRRFRNNV